MTQNLSYGGEFRSVSCVDIFFEKPRLRHDATPEMTCADAKICRPAGAEAVMSSRPGLASFLKLFGVLEKFVFSKEEKLGRVSTVATRVPDYRRRKFAPIRKSTQNLQYTTVQDFLVEKTTRRSS